MGRLRHRGSRRLNLTSVLSPSGAVVGQIIQEATERVFQRIVRERDLHSALDAWALGTFVLEQLRQWRVTRILYRAREGDYEAPLADFLARALLIELQHEMQYLLPRAFWPIRPALHGQRFVQLPLFVEMTT